MLLSGLALTYLFATALVYGSATVGLLRRSLPGTGQTDLPLPVVGVVGLAVLAIGSGYLSFVMPIGLGANLVVLAGSVLILVMGRAHIGRHAKRLADGARRAHVVTWTGLTVLALLVIVESANAPRVGDSGLYHVQTIKWLQSYSVVPGLGNLHGNYAYNSMWFPLHALAGFSFLGIQSLHVANGALYLFAAAFFLGGVEHILTDRADVISLAKAAALPLSLWIYSPQIGSPATDLPTALVLWVALLLFAERLSLPKSVDLRTTVSLLLSVFAVTVKLSAAPVALLWVMVLVALRRQLSVRMVGLAGVIVATVALPWLGRYVMLSGYLLYPFEALDLFNVDWKLPESYVRGERLAAQGYTRIPGAEWEAALSMAAWEWIPRWFAWLPYHYKLVVATTALIGLASLAVGVVRRARLARAVRSAPGVSAVYLTAWVGILYWFVSAPEPRYGFGFIFLGMTLPIATLVHGAWGHVPRYARLALAALIVLYAVNQLLVHLGQTPLDADLLVRPAPLPQPVLETRSVDGATLHFPVTTDQCWDAPLPCMPILNEGLQPRGPTLQEGFRIRHD